MPQFKKNPFLCYWISELFPVFLGVINEVRHYYTKIFVNISSILLDEYLEVEFLSYKIDEYLIL